MPQILNSVIQFDVRSIEVLQTSISEIDYRNLILVHLIGKLQEVKECLKIPKIINLPQKMTSDGSSSR